MPISFQHTPEETAILVQAASAIFSVLKEGETIPILLPLSKIAGIDNQVPMGTIILARPSAFSIIQAKAMPPAPPNLSIKDGGKS